MNTPCPANLMRAIVDVLADKELGLEPLAIASIRESSRLTPRITVLPDLPSLAEDAPSKLAVARAWLRCWQRSPGIWFNSMQPSWWNVEVRSHRGGFEDMNHVLVTRQAKQTFTKIWLPRLLADLTQRSDDGGTRLLAANLTLEIGGAWRRCPTCKSVHRPIALLNTCIDCQALGYRSFRSDYRSRVHCATRILPRSSHSCVDQRRPYDHVADRSRAHRSIECRPA